MIYTFNEQVKMMIYFLTIGMFLGIMWDTIHTFFYKNRLNDYMIQFTCWCIVIVVVLKSIDSVSWGYITIYTFMFFIIGYYVYIRFLSSSFIKILLKIKKYSKGFMLALFPISLYNYIIRNTIKKRKKINEKDNIINNNDINDDNNTRMW